MFRTCEHGIKAHHRYRRVEAEGGGKAMQQHVDVEIRKKKEAKELTSTELEAQHVEVIPEGLEMHRGWHFVRGRGRQGDVVVVVFFSSSTSASTSF